MKIWGQIVGHGVPATTNSRGDNKLVLFQVQQSDGRGWTLKGKNQQPLAFRSNSAPGLFWYSLQAKNGFYVCRGLCKKGEEEKKMRQRSNVASKALKYLLYSSLQKKLTSPYSRIFLVRLKNLYIIFFLSVLFCNTFFFFFRRVFHCMDVSLFIHYLVNGILRCFYFGVIINKSL